MAPTKLITGVCVICGICAAQADFQFLAYRSKFVPTPMGALLESDLVCFLLPLLASCPCHYLLMRDMTGMKPLIAAICSGTIAFLSACIGLFFAFNAYGS